MASEGRNPCRHAAFYQLLGTSDKGELCSQRFARGLSLAPEERGALSAPGLTASHSRDNSPRCHSPRGYSPGCSRPAQAPRTRSPQQPAPARPRTCISHPGGTGALHTSGEEIGEIFCRAKGKAMTSLVPQGACLDGLGLLSF